MRNNKITALSAFAAARRAALLPCLLLLLFAASAGQLLGQDQPSVPRIEAVEMLGAQPEESDTAVIWYDDFDGEPKHYTESQRNPSRDVHYGGSGGSMECYYAAGSQGDGNRKVFFGDSPTGDVVKPGNRYDEIYWRIYVKHQLGWTGGGPAKMSRATSIVSANWAQAMISHVWSSGEELTLDPASGVPAGGDHVVTTRYNDFDNLRWLGNRPKSEMKISSTEESGWWVCVETRVKLNTPGKADGENQLWIDGRLEAERTGLDWRGSYTRYGVNVVFLEAYWNSGSPVSQYRWYDNFVISTKPIGTVVTPLDPVICKIPYVGPGAQAAWECELSADRQGDRVVWRSDTITEGDTVTVSPQRGTFTGLLEGAEELAASQDYCIRVRQQSSLGEWSEWSRWHQQFTTTDDGEPIWGRCDINGDSRVSILDAVRLLLIQRADPADPRGDYNGDGEAGPADVTALLRDLGQGGCGYSRQSGLLAAAGTD